MRVVAAEARCSDAPYVTVELAKVGVSRVVALLAEGISHHGEDESVLLPVLEMAGPALPFVEGCVQAAGIAGRRFETVTVPAEFYDRRVFCGDRRHGEENGEKNDFSTPFHRKNPHLPCDCRPEGRRMEQ